MVRHHHCNPKHNQESTYLMNNSAAIIKVKINCTHSIISGEIIRKTIANKIITK
jgi:hypothetical protein